MSLEAGHETCLLLFFMSSPRCRYQPGFAAARSSVRAALESIDAADAVNRQFFWQPFGAEELYHDSRMSQKNSSFGNAASLPTTGIK